MRSASAIRLYYFVHFGAMGAYLPYFPAWLEARGIDGFRMSVLVALLPALSVVSPSGFGMLADALGWRGALLRAATLGATAAFVAVTLTSIAGAAPGFWGLFAALFLFAFFRTPMQLIGDVVALEQPDDYARVRMWGSIGFMLMAPMVGRFVPMTPSWSLPLSVALLFFLTHLVSWSLPKKADLPEPPVLGALQRLLREPRYRALLFATVLGNAAHVAYELCISLRLRDLGVSGTWIGVAWTVATLAEVVLMGASRPLLARFSAASLLFASLVVCVARWMFLSWVTDLTLFLVLQPLHAVTFGLRWIASMVLVKRFAQGSSLGTTQGLFLTATALGTGGGMLAWGTLYKQIGEQVFLGAAVVSSCAALATLPLLRSTIARSARARS